MAHNYQSNRRMVVDPALVPFLHEFHDLDTPAPTVAKLARHTLLEPEIPEKRTAGPGWHDWGTIAAAFHFGTKDVRWSKDARGGERRQVLRARRVPMPPPVKKARGGAGITPLPSVEPYGQFVQTLLERRTWRDFGRAKVSLQDIATLLHLTWGVQRWGIAPGQGRVALKTSPSGGACHPGEVYVLALRVKDLAPGIYHYQPDRHKLAIVRRRVSPADIGRYIPGQPWYRHASALFLMTAVFAREQWRYRMPRGYRALLVDAGHLCQTFCLTATWLRLAPFCSMALADSVIERDLGIDGVSEGILYAAGVGARPPGGWRSGVPGLRRERRRSSSPL